MKKVRRILALMLVCVMAFAITACGGSNNANSTVSGSNTSGGGSSSPDASSSGSGESSSPNTGGGGSSGGRDTLTVAINADSGTMIPGRTNGGQYYAEFCMYESLWEVDTNGNFIYQLMESYDEPSPGFWRVHLRQGVYFTNGQEMTADDVMFSLAFWKSIPVNSVRVQSIDPEKTVKVDKYTVDMYMLNGYYYYHDTGSSMFMIHSSYGYEDLVERINNGDILANEEFAAFEESIATDPVGTGPYKLNEYMVNSHVFLERRDDYWGEAPDFQFINFRVISEPAQVANAITTGVVDIAMIDLADADYIDSLPTHYTVSRYTGGGTGLSFNSGVNGYFNRFYDPEKSLEARFAVYHAIDPEVFANHVYMGRAIPMHNIIPDFMLDYKPEYDNMHEAYNIGYNLERAKELAQSSGLAGQTISIMTNGLAQSVLIAEIVQSMLAQIDVTLEIRNYDPATVNTMVYDPLSDYDITVGAGIAPNLRVCDLLLNGVRYSATLTILANSEGSPTGLPAFPGNDWYLENCGDMVYESDPVKRVEVTEKCLQMYMDEALGFGLCVGETVWAMSNDINRDTIAFSVTSGQIFLNQLKWN